MYFLCFVQQNRHCTAKDISVQLIVLSCGTNAYFIFPTNLNYTHTHTHTHTQIMLIGSHVYLFLSLLQSICSLHYDDQNDILHYLNIILQFLIIFQTFLFQLSYIAQENVLVFKLQFCLRYGLWDSLTASHGIKLKLWFSENNYPQAMLLLFVWTWKRSISSLSAYDSWSKKIYHVTLSLCG